MFRQPIFQLWTATLGSTPREAECVITRFGVDVRLPPNTTTEEATKLSAMLLKYLREEFNSIDTSARAVSRPGEVSIGLEAHGPQPKWGNSFDIANRNKRPADVCTALAINA